MEEEVIIPAFAMALYRLLQVNEGVVIHHEGKGYIVWKGANPEVDGDTEIRVRITHDDISKYEHGTLIWVHNEPVGNA